MTLYIMTATIADLSVLELVYRTLKTETVGDWSRCVAELQKRADADGDSEAHLGLACIHPSFVRTSDARRD